MADDKVRVKAIHTFLGKRGEGQHGSSHVTTGDEFTVDRKRAEALKKLGHVMELPSMESEKAEKGAPQNKAQKGAPKNKDGPDGGDKAQEGQEGNDPSGGPKAGAGPLSSSTVPGLAPAKQTTAPRAARGKKAAAKS